MPGSCSSLAFSVLGHPLPALGYSLPIINCPLLAAVVRGVSGSLLVRFGGHLSGIFRWLGGRFTIHGWIVGIVRGRIAGVIGWRFIGWHVIGWRFRGGI